MTTDAPKPTPPNEAAARALVDYQHTSEGLAIVVGAIVVGYAADEIGAQLVVVAVRMKVEAALNAAANREAETIAVMADGIHDYYGELQDFADAVRARMRAR